MKDKKLKHRHNRNSRGFDAHCLRAAPDHGGYDRRGDRAWRIGSMGGSRNPCEPHFRVTARIAALPGKHLRRVPAPGKAAHGKHA